MASSDTYIRNKYRELTGGEIDSQTLDYLRRYDDNDIPSAISRIKSGTEGQLDSYLSQQKNNVLVNMFQQQQGRVEQYLKDNPFAFDEQWLKETERQVRDEVGLEPYYKEKLSNYLEDVSTTKERAQEDEQTLLKELDRQENVYLQQDKQSFQKARESALEGLSGKGILDEGAGQRELNRGDISHEAGVGDYLSKQDLRRQQAQQTTSRLLSDLGREEGRFTTELEREKQLQIQSEVQQRKQEKQNYWEAGLKKAQGAIVPGYDLYLG